MSVGMGVALLGFSLMGPSPTASADSTDESSATASSVDASTSDAGPAAETNSSDGEDADSEEQSEPSDELDVDSDADLDSDDDTDEIDDDTGDGAATDDEELDAADDLTGAPAGVAALVDGPESEAQPSANLPSTAAAARPPAPTPSPYESSQSAHQRWVAQVLDDWTAQNQAWVNSLDVSDERKERLQASFLAMRRTFFNQAPTVAPVQITGVVTGPVTGTLGGADPDGDRLVYILTRAPRSGAVRINGDGTYTYTPGADFDGVDTFRVTAIDLGLHVNLLQLLRPLGSRAATSLVNQEAVRFEFNYTTGQTHWTDERKEALQAAADDLIEYFRVTNPVTLAFVVRGSDDPNSSTLASAGSGTISTEPGFWRTVVQNKLLGGEDSNGSEADGSISWNWGKGWDIGDEVSSDMFDFRAVAIHELLHAFGFTSGTEEPGDRDRRHWYVLDSFIVTRNGTSPISADFEWLEEFDPNLEGRNGGLYWGGPNAEDAYGRYVPIYTPDPWDEGSSGAHLDDSTFSGADEMLMNAATNRGPSVRTLSSIELGILSDIGYLVYAKAGTTT